MKATPSLEAVSKFLEKIIKETNFLRPVIPQLQHCSGKASAANLWGLEYPKENIHHQYLRQHGSSLSSWIFAKGVGEIRLVATVHR